jgi:DNA-binding transcriptional LysR family regulator
VTVVDRHGYSAAARQLHPAQSTVSHHVSELERSCNAELLRYRDRSIHLTPAGQEVYQSALVMLAEQDSLARSLGDLSEGRSGRVRLGASFAFEQKHFLAEVIARSAGRMAALCCPCASGTAGAWPRPVTVELGLVRRPGEPASGSADSLAAWLRKLARR